MNKQEKEFIRSMLQKKMDYWKGYAAYMGTTDSYELFSAIKDAVEDFEDCLKRFDAFAMEDTE